ncbi:MAG: GDSL-type esterase/lipase family protein [Bacteroidota bacterium]|nr:GDSL-type esterase/lipase family protein [Bacteroidota bacterium]
MKINLPLVLGLLVFVSGFKMQTKKKLLFFGDSITQQGAGADGYIKKMDSILTQKNQAANYELIGAGVSGNKIYDLYLRMEEDVLAKNPDAVVIFIGVNDVWHKRTSGTGTDPDKFEKFYNAIIKKLKDKNIAVYLCTPASIGEKTDFTNPLDGDLNNYAAIIRRIATTNNCTLIDLRQAFLDYLKTHNPENKDRGILTVDGVHLNRTGNIFVAGKMFDVLQQGFFKFLK